MVRFDRNALIYVSCRYRAGVDSVSGYQYSFVHMVKIILPPFCLVGFVEATIQGQVDFVLDVVRCSDHDGISRGLRLGLTVVVWVS